VNPSAKAVVLEDGMFTCLMRGCFRDARGARVSCDRVACVRVGLGLRQHGVRYEAGNIVYSNGLRRWITDEIESVRGIR